MYTVFQYDLINGSKTEIHIVEGLHFNSIAEINTFQSELQETIQRKHKCIIEVLCHYKCLIENHIPHQIVQIKQSTLNIQPLTITCDWCNSEIKTESLKKGTHIYCSEECYESHYKYMNDNFSADSETV